tara:strand:+ start:378 stop:2066 length:1689 start_codon:yes stop_codon:yes gene_type:complete
MAVKFSAFATRTTLDATTHIVGYDGSGTLTNIDFTLDTLKANTSIYGVDGTLSGARTVTMAGNGLTFTGGTFEIKDNSAVSLFKFQEDGVFTIGKNVASNIVGNVAIGSGIDMLTGGQASVTDPAIAIGLGVQSNYRNSIGIGSNARALTAGIGIGHNAGVSGSATNSISIGEDTKASAGAINIGKAGTGLGAQGANSVSIGMSSASNGASSVAIGLSAASNKDRAVSIGFNAGNNTGPTAKSSVNSISIGNGAVAGDATGSNAALGSLAMCANARASKENSIAIGTSSEAEGTSSIALGHNAAAIGNKSIYIGPSDNSASQVAGVQAIGIGTSTQPRSQNSIAIGSFSGANQTDKPDTIAIGQSAQARSTNGLAIGKFAYLETTAVNSGVINVSGVNTQVRNSDARSFKIHLSSITTSADPVLDIRDHDRSVASPVLGESTLRSSLKITGQAYTELHSGATIDAIDWLNGNVQEVTLASGSTDFEPQRPKAGATYILKITQPSGGDGTINWDNIGASNIKWPGGTEPTLTATNAAVDIATLICTSSTGQGVYYANITLNLI